MGAVRDRWVKLVEWGGGREDGMGAGSLGGDGLEEWCRGKW